MEIEVEDMTAQLNNDLNSLMTEISDLKVFGSTFEIAEANAKVDELLAKIADYKEKKNEINHDIETLEIGD